MAMTAKTTTRRLETRWEPVHLLGIGLAVYVICMSLYWGMRPDTALSISSTEGISRAIAVGYLVVGVAIGMTCMGSAILFNSLRPMVHAAAYLLAYATLALFRDEPTWAANVANCGRFLAISAVAFGAWLYQIRESARAHQ